MIDVGLIGFGLAGRAFHAQVIRTVPGLALGVGSGWGSLSKITVRCGSKSRDAKQNIMVQATIPICETESARPSMF